MPTDTTTPSAVLKPCPFCQGRAEITRHRWGYKSYYGAACDEGCGVWLNARKATRREAITAWNTRKSEAAK